MSELFYASILTSLLTTLWTVTALVITDRLLKRRIEKLFDVLEAEVKAALVKEK